MIIGIDNDKLKFVADSNGKLVVTLENLTDAIVKKELLQNCVITRCKDCKKFVVEEDQAYCLDMYGQCDENGFCAWAERKEE